MPRKALVTGATGGLGRELVTALLAGGYAVRASGRNLGVGASLGCEFMAADLLTGDVTALCAGMDVIFHCAALSSPWGGDEDFEAINVEATRRLLEAAIVAKASAFVFVSTPSLYAEAKDRPGITESSPLPPRFANAYARTKAAAERIVLAADRPGFATVAIRPRAIVGPHDQVLLPRIAKIAARGWFPLVRGGEALIEVTDARDAASALIAADTARDRAHGQAFNITGGAPMKTRDLLTEAFKELGLHPALIPVPWWLAASIVWTLEMVCRLLPSRPEPAATLYSIGTLAFTQTFDLTRARTILGWSPAYSPAQAMTRAGAAWRFRAPV
ncbi:MAG: NAD-dependent epimerase/dehydratase family protein [Caulobacteraceae bacterium]